LIPSIAKYAHELSENPKKLDNALTTTEFLVAQVCNQTQNKKQENEELKQEVKNLKNTLKNLKKELNKGKKKKLAIPILLGLSLLVNESPELDFLKQLEHISFFGTLSKPAYLIQVDGKINSPDYMKNPYGSKETIFVEDCLNSISTYLEKIETIIQLIDSEINELKQDSENKILSENLCSMNSNQQNAVFYYQQNLIKLEAITSDEDLISEKLSKRPNNENDEIFYQTFGSPVELSKKISKNLTGKEWPEKIKVEYEDLKENEDGYTSGYHESDKNKIVLNTNNNSFVKDLLTFTHETGHVFSQSGETLKFKKRLNKISIENVMVIEEACAYLFSFNVETMLDSLENKENKEKISILKKEVLQAQKMDILSQTLIENILELKKEKIYDTVNPFKTKDGHVEGMFLALAATKYFKNHQKAFNYISTTKINEINPEIIKIKNQLKQEVEESFEKEKNELREKLNTCFDKTQKLLDKLNKQYYEIVDPNNSLKIYKEYLKSKIN
jgi:hypothetical protein